MRYGLPAWSMAFVGFVVGLVGLVADPAVRFSFVWSVDAAVASVVVMWPLVLGVAAADAVRVRRLGGELLGAMPTWPATRLLGRRAGSVGGWAVVGLGVSTVAAGAVAAVHGSPPTADAFAPLLPAVVGTLAAAGVGAAVGTALPSWVVPPSLTAGAYAAVAFDVAGAQALVGFAGATSGVVVVLETPPARLLAHAGVLAAGAVVGLLVLAWTASRRWWTAAAAAAVLGLSAATWAAADLSAPPGRWSSDAAWPCAPLAQTDGEVCLPVDQRRDLGLLAGALSPMASRLAELDDSRRGASFSATRATVHEALWVPLAFGPHNFDTAALADAVAAELSPCLVEGRDLAPEEDQQLGPALVTTGWWLAPERVQDPLLLDAFGLPATPPTRAQAAQAYAVLARCR